MLSYMKRNDDDIAVIKRRLDVRPSKCCGNCSNKEVETNEIGEPELVCKVSRSREFFTLSGDVCDLWAEDE